MTGRRAALRSSRCGAAARSAAAAACAIAALLADPKPSRALEVHSFIDDGCHVRSGVLLEATETQVHLVAPDGAPATLPRARIVAVVVHRTLENPLARVAIAGRTRELLRQVTVGQERAASFVGWAVGFHDDLILFLDVHGQAHLMEREEIDEIVPPRSVPGDVRPGRFAPAALDFPPELLPCRTDAPRGSLRPVRVIAGAIKVGDYLSQLTERFADLAGFEERTLVYPRPFLFDRTTRLGLAYFQGTANTVPLYLQWSNGRPYRFQSFTALGRIRVPWLPTAAPTFSVRSDLKSHFFTASFVGHLLALPAGSSAFEPAGAFLRPEGTVGVDTLYNYLALMGADYGSWSLAGGPIYVATRIRSGGPTREVTAARSSPAVRLVLTLARLRARALYFRTRQGSNRGEGLRDEGTDAPDEGQDAQAPSAYRLRRETVRVGADLDLSSDLRVGADCLFTWGSFREAAADGSTQLSFRQAVGTLSASQTFGRYVAFTAYADLSIDDLDLATAARARAMRLRLGGALEFLF